ncbi:MAG: helix-turn-helix domain-containing protein [Oscillospiraceae bacterium]|jgi:transcriptional regulator with XRE-family HTH domain|nr:helix-turn-helix domain-containing protein [Oscillospiraceae bacterium]
MLFCEKLKQLRRAAGLTQEETAAKLGVTCRAYQNYEAGKVYPKNTGIYGTIATLFDVTADYLLSDEDRYVMDAAAKGGAKSARDVTALVSEVGSLFAGGELSEEDMDKVMQTLNRLYWRAKEKNKKYAPKKARREAAE